MNRLDPLRPPSRYIGIGDLLICAFIVLAGAAAARGQMTIAEKIAELKQQEEAIEKVEKPKLHAELSRLRRGLADSDAMAPYREALSKARDAYNEKMKADEKILAARKGEAEAVAAFDEALAKAVQADPSTPALDAEEARIQGEIADVDYQLRLVAFMVQEVSRRVGSSEEVQPAREEYQAAYRMLYYDYRKQPELVEAQRKLQEAQDAFDQKAKLLLAAEFKAVEEARTAYNDTYSKIRGEAQKNYSAAYTAMNDKIAEAVAKDFEGLSHVNRQKDLQAKRAELAKQQQAFNAKRNAVSTRLQTTSLKVKELLKQKTAAVQNRQNTETEQTTAERNLLNEAQKAYNAGLAETLAKLPEAIEVNKQLAALEAKRTQIYDHRRQLERLLPTKPPPKK